MKDNERVAADAFLSPPTVSMSIRLWRLCGHSDVWMRHSDQLLLLLLLLLTTVRIGCISQWMRSSVKLCDISRVMPPGLDNGSAGQSADGGTGHTDTATMLTLTEALCSSLTNRVEA